MNGLPYYKRYPRDFIEGTLRMSFELKGADAIILDLIYMQVGELPDDARYISGLLGVSVRKWNSLRNQLVELDKIQVTGELLTNYRAIIELESLSKYQDKQAENASGPRKNNALAKPAHKPKPSHTEPEPDTDIKNIQKDFDIFWATYPKSVRKSGKVDAKIQFSKIISGKHHKQEKTSAEIIITGTKNYALSVDPQFIKGPTAWLNAGMWEVDAPSQSEMRVNGNRSKADMYRNMK